MQGSTKKGYNKEISLCYCLYSFPILLCMLLTLSHHLSEHSFGLSHLESALSIRPLNCWLYLNFYKIFHILLKLIHIFCCVSFITFIKIAHFWDFGFFT